jgi:hypothetical protein
MRAFGSASGSRPGEDRSPSHSCLVNILARFSVFGGGRLRRTFLSDCVYASGLIDFLVSIASGWSESCVPCRIKPSRSAPVVTSLLNR